jgi:hypothetical protein
MVESRIRLKAKAQLLDRQHFDPWCRQLERQREQPDGTQLIRRCAVMRRTRAAEQRVAAGTGQVKRR